MPGLRGHVCAVINQEINSKTVWAASIHSPNGLIFYYYDLNDNYSLQFLIPCLQQNDFCISGVLYTPAIFTGKAPMCCTFHTKCIVRFHLWMLDVCTILWISVKKMHESASGVSMADVTTNRPYQTSQKIYFSEPIEGVRGECLA